MRDINEREYHVTLHANGFKSGSGFKGFDSCRAYFFTAAQVGSEEFNKLRQEKIEFFANSATKLQPRVITITKDILLFLNPQEGQR